MKLKRTAILLLLACGISMQASAAGQNDYSSYYTNMPVQLAQASAPSIPTIVSACVTSAQKAMV